MLVLGATCFVAVMVPHPGHRILSKLLFISSLRCQVEKMVGKQHAFAAASILRISMEDVPFRILIEDTRARCLGAWKPVRSIVVIEPSVLHLLLSKRHAIVIIKIAAIRRYPFESPAHPFFERIDFPERRPRNGKKSNVALCQMNRAAIKVICSHRAPRAALFPLRSKHKVIHNQLAPSLKQVCQALTAIWSVKYIILLYAHPRQLSPLAAQLIPQPCQLLLFRQKRSARLKPFFLRNNNMLLSNCGHLIFLRGIKYCRNGDSL